MEITSPTYKRNLFEERLLGTHCKTCDGNVYGETKVCQKCGRDGILETINLQWEGKVYSSSVNHTAQSGFDEKTPYATGIVELGNGVRAPALFDSEKRMTGMDVSARIGKIRETSEGLIIYGPVWEAKRDYFKPAPRIKTFSRISEKQSDVGIEGYGVYVPPLRISGEEISKVWGKHPVKSLKSFPGKWDDTATYAMNAAMSALNHAKVSGDMIEEILVGSESHPHAVYPTASKVAGLIGSTGGAADTEFACKAATEGMRLLIDSVESRIKYGMAIGADSSQAAPGDSLEYNAGDGGVAFVIGKDKPIARIEGHAVSFTTDTPDFWRNADENYPRHAERFTLEPGYYHHVKHTAMKLMKSLDLKPKDFDSVVFHQPTRDLPRRVGKILGFTEKQIEPGIVVDFVGNLYSACSPLGLAKVLDEAAPGERILLASYGSGAGSDAFSFITTEHIDEKRKNIKRSVKSWIGEEDKELVKNCDYSTYARYKGIFKNH